MKKSKGAARASSGKRSTWKKVDVSDAILQGSDEFGFVELEEMDCPVIFTSASDAPKDFLKSLTADGYSAPDAEAGGKDEKPSSPTREDLLAEVARLRAENAALAESADAHEESGEEKKKTTKKGKKASKESDGVPKEKASSPGDAGASPSPEDAGALPAPEDADASPPPSSSAPSSAASAPSSGGLSRAQKRAERLRAMRERKKAEIAERKRKRGGGGGGGDGDGTEKDTGDADGDANGGKGAAEAASSVDEEIDALVPALAPLDGGALSGDAAAPPPSAPSSGVVSRPSVDPFAWKAFDLHPTLVRTLGELGFAAPTEIQALVIPPAVRDRRDVVGAAQTGSGKTLAFGLPILQRIAADRDEEREGKEETELEPEWGTTKDGSRASAGEETRRESRSLDGDSDDASDAEDEEAPSTHDVSSPGSPPPSRRPATSRRMRALILAPTRELALQVTAHLSPLARPLGVWVVPIVGGISPQKQRRLLAHRPEVVVATPGRLWELVEGGEEHVSDFSGLEYLVVDEADRMCQRGRYEELTNVVKRIRDAFRNGGKKGTGGEEAGEKVAETFEGWHVLSDADMTKATAPRETEEEEGNEEEEEEENEEEESDAEEDDAGENGASESAALESAASESAASESAASESAASETAAHASVASESSSSSFSASKKPSLKARRLPGPAVMVFSATLTLPSSLRARLRRGGGGASGSADLQSLIDRLPFSDPRPFIADRSARAGLGAKVREARIECSEESRDEKLYELLARTSGRSLVFVNAISAARRLSSLLKALGLPVTALHGGQQQRARLRSLDAFKRASDGVLVATDVAARGLDVPNVDLVAHYQLPASLDAYVHRSGRTARGAEGAEGLAVALVTPADLPRWRALRRALRDAGGGEGGHGNDESTQNDTSGSKKASDDIQEPPLFPLDPSLAPAARERVRLAARVEAAERTLKKAAADAAWERNVADQIDGVDDENNDTDHGTNAKKKKKKKQGKTPSSSSTSLAASARLFEGEDADGVPLSRKHRAAVNALRLLKEELADLLATPLQPKYSHKYFVGGAAAGAARAGDAASAAGKGVQLAAEFVLAKRRAAEQSSRARGGAAQQAAARPRAAPAAPVSRAQALQMAVSKELERRAAKRGRGGNPGPGGAGAGAGGRKGRKRAKLPTALPRGGAPTALAVLRGQGGA